MSQKQLYLFIQTPTIGVYANVLTHCAKHEGVGKVVIVGREEPASRMNELHELIKDVRLELEKLKDKSEAYERALELLPMKEADEDEVGNERNVLRISFTDTINFSKQLQTSNPGQVIIDVSGCEKRLATDVITSCIKAGFKEVCHFQLADRVYSDEWKDMGRTRSYHDLFFEGVRYYQYDNFARSGTTLRILNRMRLQGNMLKVMLILVVLLSVVTLILVRQEQNNLALWATTATIIATAVGFASAATDLFDRFFRERDYGA